MLDVMQDVDTVCPVHGSISPQHLLDPAGVSHPYFIVPDVVSSTVTVLVCLLSLSSEICSSVCVCVCVCVRNFSSSFAFPCYVSGSPFWMRFLRMCVRT